MSITTTAKQYATFDTWAQLLDAIRAEYPIYYQAPLDYRPVQLQTTIRKDGKVRCYPFWTDADPFTADEAHLSRFRRVLQAGERN